MATTTKRAPKGSPTALNLWVLGRYFPAGTNDISNAIEATSVPHMRRCLKAGLVSVAGARLVLTDAGRVALGTVRA